MRQLLSRKPSQRSLKSSTASAIEQISRQSILKRPSRISNNNQNQNQSEKLSIKKRKFLNVVSKQKDIQHKTNLNASTVSLPVQRGVSSRITTLMAPMKYPGSNDNFLQRRSQSCASVGFSPSRHCISNTTRPVTMIIHERIVPVPMHFQYNSPNSSQFRANSQTHYVTNANHGQPIINGVEHKMTENPKHYRSAFEVLPSKQEILFCDGSAYYNSVQKQKKTLVNNNPVYDLYNQTNTQKQNSFMYTNFGIPVTPKYNNKQFFSKPKAVLQTHDYNKSLVNHLKSPSFGENFVFQGQKASEKQNSRVTQSKMQNNIELPLRPIVNVDMNTSFSDDHNKNVRRSIIVDDSNVRLIQKIDKSMEIIDKSIDRIKERTTNALKKENVENKQDRFFVEKELNQTKKYAQVIQASEIGLKDCKSSQFLKDLFKSNQQDSKNEYQQVRVTGECIANRNKQQSVYQSRVSRTSQGSLFIKDQAQNISFSRFKEFKQFQEFRQFKQKLSMMERGQKQNQSKVESSRCQPVCKHIRLLLEDYRQLRTLREYNSVKGVKQRETQKIRSSRKTPAKMYY